MKSPPSRWRLAPAGLVLFAAACADGPVAPLSCELPETPVSASAVAGLTAADIEAGLRDAESRVLPQLFAGAEGAAAREAVARVNAHLASPSDARFCVALHDARATVEALPVDGGRAVDRDLLQLVVDVTIAFARS